MSAASRRVRWGVIAPAGPKKPTLWRGCRRVAARAMPPRGSMRRLAGCVSRSASRRYAPRYRRRPALDQTVEGGLMATTSMPADGTRQSAVDAGLLILRLVLGILILFHGLTKLPPPSNFVV